MGASLLSDVPGAPFQTMRLPIASSDGANSDADLAILDVDGHASLMSMPDRIYVDGAQPSPAAGRR